MSEYTPPAITAAAGAFAKDIRGAEIAVEPKAPSRWRVTVSSPRVTMWVEYEPHSRGRLSIKNSKLFIDGEPAPVARNYAHLVEIFANPGGDRERESLAEMLAAAAPAALADAPTEVAKAYRTLSGRAQGNLGAVLRYHEGYWFVGLENEKVQLGMVMTEYLMNPVRPLRETRSGPATGDSVYLVVDGVDMSGKIQNNLEKALKVGAAYDSSPANPAIAGEAAAAVNTSVQVRRATVIRN